MFFFFFNILRHQIFQLDDNIADNFSIKPLMINKRRNDKETSNVSIKLKKQRI